MSDLIDRQDAIKAVKYGALSSATLFGRSDAGMTALRETVRVIEQLPSAQPVRKTGQWIKRKKGAIGYNCSCCGKSDISNHFDYCPNCGADMRGEQDG